MEGVVVRVRRSESAGRAIDCEIGDGLDPDDAAGLRADVAPEQSDVLLETSVEALARGGSGRAVLRVVQVIRPRGEPGAGI
jgi:hypothetical protein